jgi:hypothetical protein
MKQNPDLSKFFLAASVITKQTEQAFRAFYAALTVALRNRGLVYAKTLPPPDPLSKRQKRRLRGRRAGRLAP